MRRFKSVPSSERALLGLQPLTATAYPLRVPPFPQWEKGFPRILPKAARLRGNDERGFTLLEMLVVLVLASIMLSMVAINLFPDEQRALQDEGERLAYQLEQSGKTARIGGQPLAWSASGREHRFWKKNKQGEWRRVEQDDLLHPRSLPDDLRVTVVSIADKPAQAVDMLALSPELGAPEFELRLSSATRSLRLLGDGLGNVRVVKQ